MSVFRRGRRLFVLSVVVLALGHGAASSFAASSHQGAAAATNLIPNGDFEQGTAGWGAYHGSLAATTDGVVGPGAAKVTLTSPNTDYSITRWPRPVTSTTAGTAYSGTGWVRSDLPGASVCLWIREWSSANAVAGSAKTCITAGSAWQKFTTLSYTTLQSGGSLELFVYQVGTPASSSFEVDGLELTTGAPPPPPPPPPPPSNNLIPNGDFEQGTTGWSAYHGSLAATTDGVVGPGAAKVILTSPNTDYSIVRWPRPVTSTTAGTPYTGAGWVRSDLPGASVCVWIREWSSANAVAGSAKTCVTAGSAWQKFTTLSYTTLQSGGSLELFVYQVGTPASSSFEVDGLSLTAGTPDTTPPDTTITSGPSGTTTSTTATFSFASTEAGSTFQCALDTAAFAGCTSPMTYSSLAPGSHTFQVKAADPAGNVDSTPASATWTISNPAPTDPVMLASGDIAACTSDADEATAKLLTPYPGATIVPLGDNAYENGTVDEYTNCYGPNWGAYKASSRPTAGNHDYMTTGAAGYYGFFGSLAGDSSKGYYSYDLGSWHVVVLNSNCVQVGGCWAGSPQETWLRSDLAAHPSSCKLAYWHEPLFTSGGVGANGGMKSFWQDLYDYRADLVLNGHAHMYERFAQQDAKAVATAAGIREFVVGTGGKGLYGLGATAANSQVLNNTTFGVLKLVLHTSSYDWTFIPIPGQTFTDSGTDACHGGAPTGAAKQAATDAQALQKQPVPVAPVEHEPLETQPAQQP